MFVQIHFESLFADDEQLGGVVGHSGDGDLVTAGGVLVARAGKRLKSGPGAIAMADFVVNVVIGSDDEDLGVVAVGHPGDGYVLGAAVRGANADKRLESRPGAVGVSNLMIDVAIGADDEDLRGPIAHGADADSF